MAKKKSKAKAQNFEISKLQRILAKPNSLSEKQKSTRVLCMKEYKLVGDKFTVNVSERYSFEPYEPLDKTYYPHNGIFTVGFGEGYSIDLETLFQPEIKERFTDLMKQYDEKNAGKLTIWTNGSLQLERSLFNVLLHDFNGFPIANPRYNGGLNSAYSIKKGRDGLYRKVEFSTDVNSLSGKCYKLGESDKEVIMPFINRPIVVPGDLITLIVPGQTVSRVEKIGDREVSTVSSGADTIQEGGYILATFIAN
jgi:hypothetical protein